MTTAQQQQAARNFAAYWKDKGYEKGKANHSGCPCFRDVYGVEHPEQCIQFEEQVHLDHTSFIDGTIPATHVLIEQKGLWQGFEQAHQAHQAIRRCAAEPF